MGSVVYFASRDLDGAIKIGKTKHLRRRMKDHAGKYGRFEILGIMPGSYHEEKTIHKYFDCFRVENNLNCEYFTPNQSILRFIKNNTTLDTVKNTEVKPPDWKNVFPQQAAMVRKLQEQDA